MKLFGSFVHLGENFGEVGVVFTLAWAPAGMGIASMIAPARERVSQFSRIFAIILHKNPGRIRKRVSIPAPAGLFLDHHSITQNHLLAVADSVDGFDGERLL